MPKLKYVSIFGTLANFMPAHCNYKRANIQTRTFIQLFKMSYLRTGSTSHICLKCGMKSQMKSTETFIEDTVGKESELEDNAMKVMQLKGKDVLMIKQKGEIFALGAKCPHYGAPLCKAAMANGRIRCQWHGACFDINTGDLEDFPGLDSLPKYNVSLKNGSIIVRAETKLLESNKRLKPYTRKDPKNNVTYIIVGGGAAGYMCAQTLREEGFTGRIVIVCSEKYLPYDRVKLTKSLFLEQDTIQLRCTHFYEERDIDLHLNESMTTLNIKENTIGLSSNGKLKYDKLFLATGVKAARLDVPGAELQNIFNVRDISDNSAIRGAVGTECEVVVIGGSFISMEIASILHPVVKKLTVISHGIPFENAFGKVVGSRIMEHFEEKEVQFITNNSVKEFMGIDDKVNRVLLEDGTEIKADVCVLGVGVVSNTDFLKKTLPLTDDGGIEVDEHLQSQVKNVFVGGDIAYAPVLGTKATIRHWQMAQYHGRIAALNMVDKPTKLNSVPFFWTTLYGKGFRYCGFAPNFTSVEIRGNLEDLKFVAFYMINGGVVGAVLTVDRDPIAAIFAELLYRGERLTLTEIDSWLEAEA